jgi:hypothetical protein
VVDADLAGGAAGPADAQASAAAADGHAALVLAGEAGGARGGAAVRLAGVGGGRGGAGAERAEQGRGGEAVDASDEFEEASRDRISGQDDGGE